MNNVHPIFSNILSSFAASTTAAATPAKSSRESGDFDSHVKGIPCQVVIDSCTVVKGSHSYNAPSDLDYHGYTEIEFHLLDRKGYAASWLEKKLSEQDRIRIEEEILNSRD
jgi:type 1 fimbria pilin